MKRSLARFGYVVATLLVLGYAWITLRGPQGLPGLMEKRREIHELEQRNADLAREIEHKRQRINRLREDASQQELEIRRRLKMVRPGEKVYILQDQEKKQK